MLKQIPNMLTLARLVLAPVIAWAVWRAQLGDHQRWAEIAAVLFVIAALTDLFDGMIARALHAESKFGRLIDPIADKALVGLPLIALAFVFVLGDWPLWPLATASIAVIVARDVLMTWVRLSAPDGEGPPVSRLAKWKTALELIVVGAAILLPAAPNPFAQTFDAMLVSGFLAAIVWLIALVVTAGLSAYTAYRYLTEKRGAV
ncbi:MAG: CDP-alcohol phosphatidyltransferase family protein [Alphaproteobacteria bacterium]|nr:CDP-alcohol phosphatidyltransferase family protein [Alphaproteobacteria bacterium]